MQEDMDLDDALRALPGLESEGEDEEDEDDDISRIFDSDTGAGYEGQGSD